MKNLILPITILLLTTQTVTSQVTTEEFEALKALYRSTEGDNWTNNTNWDTTATEANVTSAWHGLTVSGGNVTDIDLNTNNLVGTLPVEIGNFPNLETLYLWSNQISGSIPIEIGNLINIQHLYLYSNQLENTIPNEIISLTNLTALSLSYNQLNGDIPINIGNLINLTFFKINSNQFSGTIPVSLTDLISLKSLSLSNNNFSGTIPSSISNLGSLEFFNLSNNDFTGSLPTNIGNLANLIEADFSNNEFEGAIPEGLGNIAALTDLDISGNKYTFEELEAVIDTLPSFTVLAPQDSLAVDLDEYNLTEGDALDLTLTTGGDNNVYQWYKGSSSVSSESASPDYSVAATELSHAGTYFCKVTNTLVTGLQLYSKEITVTIEEAPTALNDNQNNLEIKIGSNPTHGPIQIEAENLQRITVQNLTGQIIYASQANGENPVQIDLTDQPAGIYFLFVEIGNELFRKKIIVL